MSASEFVIEKINAIVELFPFVSCRYQFDEFSQSHYIEVIPKQYLEISEDFTLFQCDVISEFMDEFPNESVTFITEGDLVEIRDVLYSASGKLYKFADFGTYPENKLKIQDLLPPVFDGSDYSLAA